MRNLIKKKWFWITCLFATINIAGLFFVVSAINERQDGNLFKSIHENLERIARPFIRMRQQVTTDFAVQGIEPESDGAQAEIIIKLNGSVDLESIKGYITVEPETKFYLDNDGYGVSLKGLFLPGKTYKVTVLKGMPSTDGVKLLSDTTENVTISDYAPNIRFKTPGLYMALKGAENILIESVNVDKAKLKIHKVFDNNIVYLLNRGTPPTDIGIDVTEKDIPIAGEHNHLVETTIGLKELIPGQRGIFYLSLASGEEERYTTDDKLILNTDIGILAKQSSHDLLVWLNALADTTAVSNATVKVFSKTNQLICQGTSDENGVVHFKGLDFSGDKKPFVITASSETDLSYLEVDPNVLSEADFDVQGRPYLSNGYEAFVYTDRGVYRPGEKVFLRAIVRAAAVAVPEQFPVTVSIKRPDGKEFKKLTGILSDLSTLDLAVDIPDYAPTGEYQAQLLVPGNDQPIGETKFNIEEFVPDSLKVTVKTAADSYHLSDVVPLMVKVRESFGAAASGRNIAVSYQLNPVDFGPKGFEDFSFVDDSIKYKPENIEIQNKASDTEGQGYFELELPKNLTVPSSLEASIKTVVSEIGGHAVTNYSSVKVHPYLYYIGIRKSLDGFSKTNEAAKFDILALLPDGTEHIVPQLKVKICRIIWSNILKKDDKGTYDYMTESREELVKEDSLNMNSSKALYAFTPKDWGDYIIRVSGTGPDTPTAALKFYVSGAFNSQPWAMERPDKINLKFDRDNYEIGDAAKLLVQSPFKGKALIICSTQSVVYTQSLAMNASTQEVEIPVTQDFGPNAYCSASVIRPLVYEENWSSHRAYGIAPLILNHKANQITVKVNAPEKIGPTKTLKLDIETTGGPSELSVALVDDAVLRLTAFETPDPYGFFYGKRTNEVLAADIYSQLIPEIKDKKVALWFFSFRRWAFPQIYQPSYCQDS